MKRKEKKNNLFNCFLIFMSCSLRGVDAGVSLWLQNLWQLCHLLPQPYISLVNPRYFKLGIILEINILLIGKTGASHACL